VQIKNVPIPKELNEEYFTELYVNIPYKTLEKGDLYYLSASSRFFLKMSETSILSLLITKMIE